MSPKILAKGPILPENITIITSQSSQRKTNQHIEEIISNTWTELEKESRKKDQMLWNGESLRLDDLKEENEKLILSASVTNYRNRTCLEKNMDKVENLGFSYFSAGLAIGGFVETLDGFYVFNQRSPKSISRHQIDFIGGVMDNIQAKSGLDLLEHNYLEIQEELNLGRENVENIRILGLILSNFGNVIIVTYTKLLISFDQLKFIFDQGHDEEVQALAKVKMENLPKFMSELGGYKPICMELLD